jgi:hypothetical protein
MKYFDVRENPAKPGCWRVIKLRNQLIECECDELRCAVEIADALNETYMFRVAEALISGNNPTGDEDLITPEKLREQDERLRRRKEK